MACGIKWRNASPRRPPEAKLRRILSRCRFSFELSSGIKNRIRNGAALMRSVEVMASNQRLGFRSGRDGAFGGCVFVGLDSWKWE
jgi:hypothetical protein